MERLEGRIQYLERTSDMALIQVILQRAQPVGSKKWGAILAIVLWLGHRRARRAAHKS